MLHVWKGLRCSAKTGREYVVTLGGVVTPDCCDAVKTLLGVRLAYRCEDMNEERFDAAVPNWRISLPSEILMESTRYVVPRVYPTEDPPPVTTCPWCGTPLPTIKKRPKIKGKKTHRPESDGDYCAACGERSMECGCLRPEAAWMPVTEVT